MKWKGKITVVGYGKHGYQHCINHAIDGAGALEVYEIQDQACARATRDGLMISTSPPFKKKDQPWLVDICTWNTSHAEDIVKFANMGSDVILVEKPAVSSQKEFFDVLKQLDKYGVPVFVSEHYLFSRALNDVVIWLKTKKLTPLSIKIIMSKDRTQDFRNHRGGKNTRVVDVELPHAVAMLKKLTSAFIPDISDYNSINVNKISNHGIDISLGYGEIHARLISDLEYSKIERMVTLETKVYTLTIIFDVQYPADDTLKRYEVFTILNKSTLEENRFVYETNYLQSLLQSVKKNYLTPNNIGFLLLSNFRSDIMLLETMGNLWGKQNYDK